MIIYKLKDIPKNIYDSIGGKAKGLRELIKAGLEVPEGFVVADMKREEDYAFATDYYAKSGLKHVAVRSSASIEDGVDFSVAGQYVTYLNVSDRKKLSVAIKKCMESLKSNTSGSHVNYFSGVKSDAMSIVVQEMVDAKYSGVCFSKNPLNGENEIIIEAVKGITDRMILGKAKIKRYVVPYREEKGKIAEFEQVCEDSTSKLLPSVILSQLCTDVAKAVEFFGYPLDLEWAIDKSGQLFWLQARPITTLDSATIDEFDGLEGDENTVFTTANTGEMLSGAVTPLSLSTTVYGIDYALRSMLIKAGAFKSLKYLPARSCIANFSNHLFFNLSNINKIASVVMGTKKDDIERSVCGKVLNTPNLAYEKQNGIIRAKNGFNYLRFIMSSKKAINKIDALAEKLVIEDAQDLQTLYDNITVKIDCLLQATLFYYITSAHSGAMSSALFQTVNSAFPDADYAKRRFSELLTNIEDFENIDIIYSMRKVARETLNQYPAAADFSIEKLYEIIKKDDKKIKEAYDHFIAQHGHRTIREMELRSKSWKNDELLLMNNILTLIKSSAEEPQKSESRVEQITKELLKTKKPPLKPIVKYMINQARIGVYNKEYAKSKYIKIIDVFKQAYSKFADSMVLNKIIKDKDLIFFLTHEELGRLIIGKESKLLQLAVQRRKLLGVQSDLSFNEVSIGNPVSLNCTIASKQKGAVLNGIPVSRGEARGRARVVKNAEDAMQLKDGEIMIAAFTDIEWLPFYAIASGLITESGSLLSQGAVVAREYGMPLVANVSNATRLINTGDYIHIDGSKGMVTILAEP